MQSESFRAWFRSRDLRVMGPPRFHCATLNSCRMFHQSTVWSAILNLQASSASDGCWPFSWGEQVTRNLSSLLATVMCLIYQCSCNHKESTLHTCTQKKGSIVNLPIATAVPSIAWSLMYTWTAGSRLLRMIVPPQHQHISTWQH